MTAPSRRLRLAAALCALGVGAAACSGPASSVASGQREVPAAAGHAAGRGAATAAAPPAASAPRPVAPLKTRVRPDVLVVSRRPLAGSTVQALRRLSPAGFTTFRAGMVRVAGTPLGVAGVDASSFRAFAPQGTAESDPVWNAVSRGDLVVAHDVANARRWALGATARVAARSTVTMRLGAIATTNLPDTDVVVSDAVAASLGLAPTTGVLLTSGRGDPAALASAARRVVGRGGSIHLLTQPATPFAFLTGSKAAKAFGAFSYRWYDDGTIEPDRRWVAANIVSTTVPVIGRVTCHRLMVPQLRAALAEVEANGLGHLLKTFDGCYVPRFIERDPSHAISLHTWGIAIDFDAATNARGGRGTMDARIVSIFKRWGFRWGGDWSYTDPMHFELGALLDLR
ncbi:MAG TPA: M15 family metallopeptidase [Frankiaceae bacterium]|nr:M15 family metallopeptidase [Frankiaceae bacterium]